MRELAAAALFCAVAAAQTAWEQSMAVGMKALGKGSYGEAQQQFEAALEAAESRPQEATTLARLGCLWERQKEWVRAGEYYARSLSAREKEYGPESAEVATGLEHLARVLVKTGREEEAKEKQARAFGIRAARIAAESTPPGGGGGGGGAKRVGCGSPVGTTGGSGV